MAKAVKAFSVEGDLVQIQAKQEHALSNHWKSILRYKLDPKECAVILRTNLWMQNQEPLLDFLAVCWGVCLVTNSAATIDRVFGGRLESTIRFAALDTRGSVWRQTNGALQLTNYTHLTEIWVRDADCISVFANSPRLFKIRVFNAIDLNAARLRSIKSLRELDLTVLNNVDACEALAQAGSIRTIEKIRFVDAPFATNPSVFEGSCSPSLRHLAISVSTQGTCKSLFAFFAKVRTFVIESDVFNPRATALQDTWRDSFHFLRCQHLVIGRPVYLKGKHVISDALGSLDALVDVKSLELYVDDVVPFRVSTFVESVRLVSHRWTRAMVEAALRSICTRLEIIDFGDSLRDEWIDCPPALEILVSRAPPFTPPREWWV